MGQKLFFWIGLPIKILGMISWMPKVASQNVGMSKKIAKTWANCIGALDCVSKI